MDLFFSIFAAFFIVQWQLAEVNGYSLTNATDSGEFMCWTFAFISAHLCTFMAKRKMFGKTLKW